MVRKDKMVKITYGQAMDRYGRFSQIDSVSAIGQDTQDKL